MTDFNAGHKALLEKYGGTALPHALLIDAGGNVVKTFSGMFTAKTLAQAILHLSTP
jgi:thiol:disulfide interchange protein